MRLPSIRNEFNEVADRAAKDQMAYRGFPAELLMTECDDRARRRSERRVKAAGLPREKSLGVAPVLRTTTTPAGHPTPTPAPHPARRARAAPSSCP